MFEFIRTHQRLMQFVLLLFIFPSFAFFGLEGYSRLGDDENAVVKMEGQTISQSEFDEAHREQMERLRQKYGAQFDPKMFDTPESKKSTLDTLIAQRVLSVEATRNHLNAPDQVVQKNILEIPGMIKDGKFDYEHYKSLLAARGYTANSYEARVRHDLVVQQVNTAVQASAFAPKSLAARFSDINDQEREVQVLSFKAADFMSQVKVTDVMLKDYYEKNGKLFEIPEQVKAEYVVLDSDIVASQVSVSDDEIKSMYEQNKKRYTVEEQRRASHILIMVKKDAPAAEKAAAKAKAENLLAQVRKHPANFAVIAKENSQDTGSAERGGDLDFFSKGMMVKPFEDAAAKLEVGDISDLVLSDFGYHIIQLTGIKRASVKTLEEAKPEIAADIQKTKAAKKYSELAEIFTNTVYEQADSLKPVADKLKLKIETAANLTRQPNPSTAPTAAFNNPKFLTALFSDDAIKNKRNTEAVEVAPRTLVAGRIVEYKPVAKRPFAEVQATILIAVTQAEAAKLAQKAGEAKLAALKLKDDTSGFSESKKVSRSKNGGLEGFIFPDVIKADVSKLPVLLGVLQPQGYSIARINKVAQAATPDQARRKSELQQIESTLAQQETLAYIEVLKEKAKVKILKPIAKGVTSEGVN